MGVYLLCHSKLVSSSERLTLIIAAPAAISISQISTTAIVKKSEKSCGQTFEAPEEAAFNLLSRLQRCHSEAKVLCG